MKQYYQNLKAQLTTKLPTIAHINLWNEQITNLDDEAPFLRPAIFVEIEPLVWEQINKTTKRATVNLTLHVVSDCYDTHADDTDAMQALDLTDLATEAMETSKLPNSTLFNQTQSVIDNNHGNLIINQISFTSIYTKCIGNDKTYISVTPDLLINAAFE